ncbi:hypothetical protein L1987_08107 [Smallanthus sonchifolius]|uniref:Uncharacterized protein n=1 Tax=Smallanthus sonchifolius TaxID=185202 RepID=A0ACB9JJN8_9ASTR|nr:hypothetical protein L1987_08107 [Smallanthus sonchifolius]
MGGVRASLRQPYPLYRPSSHGCLHLFSFPLSQTSFLFHRRTIIDDLLCYAQSPICSFVRGILYAFDN